ncbi:RsfA family transcriptional regulator [Desulfuribacillus alkaliarsenatis]|uniref:Precorrin-3B C(17)-methyltransferase n=1 Tax=Desulfuribacillus alkaliarsenatis TaxID=766136 RepID=A0A1E5FZS9_9FIRM|nr:RsfA family transcriptional regulator [Desulfuribacillus alkaliarsenatis]OEF96087.1 precorrin-3B C(17)-methyltransferase [Desulfuribacillus alkaliarsenatis]
MTVNRQDAWTEEDDLLLAEVILRHIRDGSTQLNAFEEVGEKLSRTAAACGFRWNSVVRRRYEAAIEIAKAQRQAMKKGKKSKDERKVDYEHTQVDRESVQVKGSQFEEAIKYLKQMKNDYGELKRRNQYLERRLSEYESEVKRLTNECAELKKEKNHFDCVSEDYKALIQIMDRARKLTVLNEDKEEKPKFRMDMNGNLERV